jgi:predicted metal-dependent hydrolase
VVVRPDGTVEVHAPKRSSASEIRSVVEEFRPWIEKKRREALERVRRRRARRFDDGDDVPYLGGNLRLRIDETESATDDAVVRDGGTLRVSVPPELTPGSRRAVVRFAVHRWLLDEARDVFHRRHVAMSRAVGQSARRVVIKNMRSRWGSCGPDRLMNLNWRLVLAPEAIIDYVLVHELTHITEPNHSPAFWRRVGRSCGHFEESRDWLRVHGDDLEL